MAKDETTRLRIAILNATDYAGGAESVARALLGGMVQRGHEVMFWVGRRRKRDAGYTRQVPCTEAQRQTAKRHAERGFFSLGLPSSEAFSESAALAGIDLIHLHNLHGHYFSITSVPRLVERAHLVWTFHDFFPLTGGCVFPQACDRWMSQCGSCPQQGAYPIGTEFDRTRRMQSVKRKTFADLPVTIVTPSRHLARAVRRSGVFPTAELHTIPYGVETRIFHPHRERARAELGIAPGRPVVLLAAQGLTDPRKGLDHAVTALRKTDVPEMLVLLAGRDDVQTVVEALSMHEVRTLGYLTDPAEMSRCHAAADLLVFTSLAENYPCVVQEAMACGTAVLAFDIDGVDEQIVHGHTGFLVPPGDTNALAHHAKKLLTDLPALAEVGAAACRHAETNWNPDVFIDRHERLYRDILARDRQAR